MAEKKQKYPKIEIQTPRGRLVQGNLHTPGEKDFNGDDREVPQYFFALAVHKHEPGVGELIQQVINHAFTSYSFAPTVHQIMNSFMPGAKAPQGFRDPFAWKIADGDVTGAGREGWAGCWVFKFATLNEFNVWDINGNKVDPKQVKLGSYARVSAHMLINGGTTTNPGIYLNPLNVQMLDVGPEIIIGQTFQQAFGASPPPLPAGAVAWTGVAPMPPAPGTAPTPQFAPAPHQPQYTAPPAPQGFQGGHHGNPGVPTGWPQNQPQPPAPPAPTYNPPAPAQPTAEQIAAHYGVQHHPGFRFDGQGYVPDVLTPPPPPQQYAPVGNPQAGQFQPHPAQGAPAYAPGAPAGAAPGQHQQFAPPTGPQPGYQTASPSNPPAAGAGMPPIQPYGGFIPR